MCFFFHGGWEAYESEGFLASGSEYDSTSRMFMVAYGASCGKTQ